MIDKLYEALFSIFLIEETPIMEIDKMLEVIIHREDSDNKIDGENDLFEDYFSESKEEKHKIGKSMPKLNYFRLISKARIEKLTDADKGVLENMLSNEDESLLNDAMNVVKRTYNDVMCVNKDDHDNMTCLGPYADPEFCFANDSIVLGLIIPDSYMLDDNITARIEAVAKDMKNDMFKIISDELNTKIVLFTLFD